MLLSPFDQKCCRLMNELPKRHSRNCFRSAINHLEMAEKVLEIDPIMAAFRGLTAEEEAASGLMHCLKEKGYQNAHKLKPRDHVHKSAVSPFLAILGMFFSEVMKEQSLKTSFMFQQEDGKDVLLIVLQMHINGEEKLAHPIPPFNFTVKSDDKRLSYKRQIDFLAEHRGVKNLANFIRDDANFRNRLLYASPEGYPAEMSNVAESLIKRQTRVMAMIRGYLMIQPYQEQQSFVQDSLDAFLAMIGELKEHDLHDEV